MDKAKLDLIDVVILTAADGEDAAVRDVDAGAMGSWREITKLDGFPFSVWLRTYMNSRSQPIRVLLSKALAMGVEASALAAAKLVDLCRPRCLAMCGVCAGRPGWTELGDVIVADRVYRYDTGQIHEADGQRTFHSDLTTYQIPATWMQLAKRIVISPDAPWLALRPRTETEQHQWLLLELHAGRDPRDASNWKPPPDWQETLETLWRNRWLKQNKFELTERGRSEAQKLTLLHPSGLPESRVPRVHVGPLATGSSLQKSDRIWNELVTHQRLLCGLDMEGSVVGFVGWAEKLDHVVIKGVMDFAEPGRTHRFKAYAARAAAEVLLEYLRTVDLGECTRVVSPCRVGPPRLPRVSGKLVGRENEVAQLQSLLDAALGQQKPRTHVATLVAWGGVGKTALVARFLDELAARDWPGLERVFEWSFYSQGTRDQSGTSADTFVKEALAFFGDKDLAESSASAWDKGVRLATLVAGGRHLLILDGLEPLQQPPGPQAGTLKDGALQALLVGLARQAGESLCVITTRETVTDLRRWHEKTVRECHLQALSDVAGAQLLRQLGVNGSSVELETLSRDVQGHALTLEIFGSYLKRAHGGDVRKRDHVHFESADVDMTGGHAARVMGAYESWLATGGNWGRRQIALLRLMGLFDRPADPGCIISLRNPPEIPGLTEPLVDLTDAEWNATVHDLEQAGLVKTSAYEPCVVLGFDKEQSERPLTERGEPDRYCNPDAFRLERTRVLDVHPLLRDYFGRQLREGLPEASRAAHQRLFEHLAASVPYWPDGLEGLQPLLQAIAHGCQAGLHEQACNEVYRHRVERGEEFYCSNILGAFGAELGALAWLFEKPWVTFAANLADVDQGWVQSEVAYALRSIGRLADALDPMRGARDLAAKLENWEDAAIASSNLSQIEVSLGDIATALAEARRAIDYADRLDDRFWSMLARTTLADALHQANHHEEALVQFREAEAMQTGVTPSVSLLYSQRGFRYCDLLLRTAERTAARGIVDLELGVTCRSVRERAQQTILWATRQTWVFDEALDYLTIGRTELYESVLDPSSHTARSAASDHLNRALEGLRASGRQDFIPRALVHRAWLRSLGEDRGGACADLDEAQEIAERGSMWLHVAEVHLQRARLLHDRVALGEAKKLIDRYGYERRRAELEDAEVSAKDWQQGTP